MRITEKMLEQRVEYLNEITSSPSKSYTDGKSNVGNFHLYFAYGGVNLHRICNEGGGITEPIGGGCGTKRELYEKLNSFINGLQFETKNYI